jgi:hypothetical protein
MIDQVRVDTPAAADWPDLVDELDRWGAAGQVAAIWWRDDDAVAATPRLDALLRLAGEVPLALAVIPALARPDLAEALSPWSEVAVLQHGWQHLNHAGAGRKSEYPQGRPAAVVEAEITLGQARLKALLGLCALPVLVPPWNRFAGEYLPLLAAAGIAGLSAMASQRPGAVLPCGLAGLDVHVDLVAWRGDRGFVGTAAALGGLIGQLRARRLEDADGGVEAATPIGILTHHLIMDGATAAFLDRLIATARGHAAIRWAGAREMLQ